MAIDLGCDAPDRDAPLTLLTPSAVPSVGLLVPQEIRSAAGVGDEDRSVPRRLCVTGKIERFRHDYRVSVSRSDQLHFDAALQPQPNAASELLFRACDEGVVTPQLLHSVGPQYTSDAMRAHIQGSVLLQGVVGIDGATHDVRVLRSLDADTLDQAAVKAFQQWRFQPGSHLGTPVPIIVTAKMAFTLGK
jgi:TonB family protein